MPATATSIPSCCCDERDRDLTARAQAASREVLEECIACGGSITAEHGVGIEKIELMEKLFAPADLRAMHRVRQAFDPAGRLNPGKKFKASGRWTVDGGPAISSTVHRPPSTVH